MYKKYCLQQQYVLAELEEYALQTPIPVDSQSVMQTVMYLKACNQLFEQGILFKSGFIRSTQSPVLVNINKGFQYFSEWADSLIQEGTYNESYTCTLKPN